MGKKYMDLIWSSSVSLSPNRCNISITNIYLILTRFIRVVGILYLFILIKMRHQYPMRLTFPLGSAYFERTAFIWLRTAYIQQQQTVGLFAVKQQSKQT